MVSSLHFCSLGPSLQIIPSKNPILQHPKKIPTRISISHNKNHYINNVDFHCSCSSSGGLPLQVLQKSCAPLALSLVIFWSAAPAQAGFLSGSTGIESVPGPKLPTVDFLNSYIEDYQKKYTENDERFKSSPIIKELLERSKMNKEKNKQEIMDKYCIRGAEWGVGDCSTQGMTDEEKVTFIAMLKKKAGVE